ncbi:MAG: hypothetical protein A2X46_10200 [Lentisphaerae bacterium GWF2_57_35]|nr:MAG: hypothetical protein A2X46_10200 [Lentisphaerae bacterium GWF2_57_35]
MALTRIQDKASFGLTTAPYSYGNHRFRIDRSPVTDTFIRGHWRISIQQPLKMDRQQQLFLLSLPFRMPMSQQEVPLRIQSLLYLKIPFETF